VREDLRVSPPAEPPSAGARTGRDHRLAGHRPAEWSAEEGAATEHWTSEDWHDYFAWYMPKPARAPAPWRLALALACLTLPLDLLGQRARGSLRFLPFWLVSAGLDRALEEADRREARALGLVWAYEEPVPRSKIHPASCLFQLATAVVVGLWRRRRGGFSPEESAAFATGTKLATRYEWWRAWRRAGGPTRPRAAARA